MKERCPGEWYWAFHNYGINLVVLSLRFICNLIIVYPMLTNIDVKIYKVISKPIDREVCIKFYVHLFV